MKSVKRRTQNINENSRKGDERPRGHHHETRTRHQYQGKEIQMIVKQLKRNSEVLEKKLNKKSKKFKQSKAKIQPESKTNYKQL